MGQQNNVNFSLPARAGKIYPPNAAAVPISLTYEPSILFTLSDGLGAGSVTTLRTVTATAVFSSDVSGVVKADVLVTNAQYSNFVKVSPSVRVASTQLLAGCNIGGVRCTPLCWSFKKLETFASM